MNWVKSVERVTLALLFLCFVSPIVFGQGTPLNETGLPAEADFCKIQFPSSLVVNSGEVTQTVYGQIYEAGVTEEYGGHPSVSAQLGYGPVGTNPWEAGWIWTNAFWNVQSSYNDEYYASVTAPSYGGDYSYCFRFSFDGMASATYSDLDGAGSNAGHEFSLSQLGPLTVIGPVRCCAGRVGDANSSGEDEPTIGDVSTLIDAKFITGSCDGILTCLDEADVNQSATGAATCEDITIGDISTLIDYLFITGPTLGLPSCL